MTETFRTAIETGDIRALTALLEDSSDRATQPIPQVDHPKVHLPPLHHVCDAVFQKQCTGEAALEMAGLLLEHGVDVNQVYTKSGDSYLITAASLGAEAVGILLVEKGADVDVRGLFGATALHWSAMMGLHGLASALVGAGADIHLLDTKYKCTPLQWAQHAWAQGTNGNRDGIPRTAAVLIAAGASVPSDLPQELQNARVAD